MYGVWKRAATVFSKSPLAGLVLESTSRLPGGSRLVKLPITLEGCSTVLEELLLPSTPLPMLWTGQCSGLMTKD
jgi:hypothetical protein